jgi:hypothetical protein
MDSRVLDRQLDWIALHMLYIVGPALGVGLATLVAAAVLHG